MSSRRNKRKVSGVEPQSSRPTIGLLLSEVRSSYGNALWVGVADAALEFDVNLICYVGGQIDTSEYGLDLQRSTLYDLIDTERVDGLLICGTIGNFATEAEFRSFIDRYRPVPMVGITETPGIPNIIVDNGKGIRDIVTHFIEVHGYRRIAFICGPENNEEAALRYRAYVDALAEHDIPLDPDLVAPGAFEYETGVEAVRLLLDERKAEFEAVVAANDWMAFGALRALEEHGVRIPEDVALGGFDDVREAAASKPSLTTVRQPIHRLGYAGIGALLKLLAGEQVPERTMLSTRLVVRRSCSCVEPAIAYAAVGSLTRKRQALKVAVDAQRGEILSEMAQAVEGPAPACSEWMGRLLDAFLAEMGSGSAVSEPGDNLALQGSFLSTLDDVLQKAVAMNIQIDDWQEVISVMRHRTVPYMTNVATLSRAEDLFNQGRVTIGQVVQGSWALQEVEDTQRTESLGLFSGDLVAAIETEQTFAAIGHRLPQLGFSNFYLSLYEGQRYPAEWSRLMLAYEKGERVDVGSDGRHYLTRRLVPDELFPRERRYTWVVGSLSFRENQFGLLILETGPRAGDIYGALAGQISGTLQDSLLVRQLEVRKVQMLTAAEVSQVVSSLLDPDELIQRVVELVQERFDLYYVGLFLVDGGWVVLRAATGEAGEKMLEQGHRLQIGGGSMVGRCIGDHQACIAADVGEEAVRFDNPLLPETRSELALPLVSREGAIGALSIQSTLEKAFSEEDVAIFQTMADQLANAIANARLYEKIQKAYAEVERQVQERTAQLQREVAERARAQEENLQLQQEVIEAQQRAIRELSTPIIPVLEGVIVVPLIGSIDTARARDITRNLLAGIRAHNARIVILDITGVPIVDSGVAAYLNKTIQAARLKGTRAIVTGISEAVATTIVDLGIDWSGVETLSDLKTGLRVAIAGMRQRVGENSRRVGRSVDGR
jgi:DNA-binding LacI/PurR family transcriptional regulator/anti-anti-sigma regulatory factor/putative methionine-R-sulfoxide reductase with GAF domain